MSSPIKLFEYLASGLPLMATRIRCHTDVIHDSDVVFWMDGADVPDIIHALTRIGKRIERLPVMSRKSLALAEKFTWGTSSSQLSIGLHSHLEGMDE